MEQQILKGTWEKMIQHGPQLSGERVRLTVLPDDGLASGGETKVHPQSYGFYYGVFSGEPQPRDEDFKSAEFHGDPDEGRN